ncbi:MAG: GNAT family acetyltransferase [Burkholderiaceae bacterium]
MNPRFRPFTEPDRDAVVALWQACGLLRPWNDPHRDIDRKLRVQADGFLVATVDDRVVAAAMAGYDGHRGWVNYLAVDPELRGRGLGRALMGAVESWLLAMGCPKINLQVRADNLDAIAFYRRIGFGQDASVSLGKRLVPDEPTDRNPTS